MNDRFIISYEINHKLCKSDYLTEDELGHEIARLMRRGACGVKVSICDSERLEGKIMYIQLMHRHFGLHEPIKHTQISCDFSKIYLGEDNINEELLLRSIPEGWLPTKPNNILLTVGDKYGTTGQCGLSKFRSWGKYFDSYVLELHREPLDWWSEQQRIEND